MENRPGANDPSVERVTRRRSGLGPPSVRRAAFGVSVAIHVLAILLYPTVSRRLDPQGAAFPFPQAAGSPGGIEVIEVVEVDVLEELERPEDPEEVARIDTAPVEVARPTLGGPDRIELPAPGLTPAEILQPRITERRIWAPPPREWSELTLEQREELLVAGRLEAWMDSVNAANAAASAWTDWTFTDGDGGRWGFSEQGLHLGDLTIPIPTLDAAYGQQRAYLRDFDEMARQGAQAAVQESVRERMEAIRARRDAERARERAAQPADTTDN